ncbi:hypothetical protein Dimus_028276 [Dionaea muscipula]
MKMASESNPSSVPIRILLVDDDSISLSIVSGQLRKYHHQVLSMKNPMDALSTLRVEHESFDLVFTDVHMPEMNGIQLQKIVLEEFRLPVVLMSGDNEKETMLQGLENGASFYFVKPISHEHLDKLWQYALNPISKREEEQLIYPAASTRIENPRRICRPRLDDDRDLDHVDMMMSSTTHHGSILGNNYKSDVDHVMMTQYSKRKNLKAHDNGGGGDQGGKKEDRIHMGSRSSTASGHDEPCKKHKVVWTTLLHNQFLEAVNKIGLDKAVPKKILEIMNVKGLRRENVASHLQKYRIFLRRVSEANKPMQNGLPKGLNDRPLRSSFALNHLAAYGGLNNNSLGNGFPQETISTVVDHHDEAAGINQLPSNNNYNINDQVMSSSSTQQQRIMITSTDDYHAAKPAADHDHDHEQLYTSNSKTKRPGKQQQDIVLRKRSTTGTGSRISAAGSMMTTTTTSKVVSKVNNNFFCGRSNYVGLQIIANNNDDYDQEEEDQLGITVLLRGVQSTAAAFSQVISEDNNYMENNVDVNGSAAGSLISGCMLTFGNGNGNGNNISFGPVPMPAK